MENNNSLVTIEQVKAMTVNKAVALFSDYDNVSHLIDHIREQAESQVADVSTDKGRRAIGTNASNVSKSKIYLTDCCDKAMTDMKDRLAKIKATKSKITEECDGIRQEVLKPREEWKAEQERIEKERVSEIHGRIENIRKIGNYAETDSAETCGEKIEALNSIDVSSGFDEFTKDAAEAIKSAIKSLTERTFEIAREAERRQLEEETAKLRRDHEIDSRVNALQMIPMEMIGKSKKEIREKISSLERFQVDESDFLDRVSEVESKVEIVISQLKTLEAQAPEEVEKQPSPIPQDQASTLRAHSQRLDQGRAIISEIQSKPSVAVDLASGPDETAEMIGIPASEYKRLIERDEFLSALEAAGVDSWDGYDEAIQMLKAS